MTVALHDLLVWQSALPDVDPPPTYWAVFKGPNPLWLQDIVVGAFQGSIFCVEANDGHLVWRQKLGRFAGGLVLAAKDLALVRTERALAAFHPLSGKILWELELVGGAADWPRQLLAVVSQGRILVGNGSGDLLALDAGSGRTLWSAGRGTGVFTPVAVIDPVAVFGTQQRRVVAVDVMNGQVAWKSREIDEPVMQAPIVAFGGVLVHTRSRLYLFDKRTGSLINEWEEPKRKISQVEAAKDSVVVVTSKRKEGARRGAVEWSSCTVKAVRADGRVLWEHTEGDVPARVRWIPSSERLFSVQSGLTARDGATGRSLWHIDGSAGLTISSPGDLGGRNIFLVTYEGNVLCIRDPELRCP